MRNIIAPLENAATSLISRSELSRFINIYVEGEDVRFQDNRASRVAAGSHLSIVLPSRADKGGRQLGEIVTACNGHLALH